MTSVIQQIYCALYCDWSPHPWDAPVNGYMEAKA